MGCEAYDCVADVDDWSRAWSDTKKEWCCKTHSKGCEVVGDLPGRSIAELKKPKPYDCEVAAQSWQVEWSNDKMEYCCTKSGRGCFQLPPKATPAPLDTTPLPVSASKTTRVLLKKDLANLGAVPADTGEAIPVEDNQALAD